MLDLCKAHVIIIIIIIIILVYLRLSNATIRMSSIIQQNIYTHQFSPVCSTLQIIHRVPLFIHHPIVKVVLVIVVAASDGVSLLIFM